MGKHARIQPARYVNRIERSLYKIAGFGMALAFTAAGLVHFAGMTFIA